MMFSSCAILLLWQSSVLFFVRVTFHVFEYCSFVYFSNVRLCICHELGLHDIVFMRIHTFVALANVFVTNLACIGHELGLHDIDIMRMHTFVALICDDFHRVCEFLCIRHELDTDCHDIVIFVYLFITNLIYQYFIFVYVFTNVYIHSFICVSIRHELDISVFYICVCIHHKLYLYLCMYSSQI